MRSVYLDNHATTPLDPRVLEAMLPYFREKFGNAASKAHRFGWEAERAVEHARKQVADLMGAEPREVVFTSGASESDNLALKGIAEACRGRANHIITAATEHKAILDSARHLERLGCRVTVLPVEADGRLDVARLADAIEPDTMLVSIMYANNEVGAIHPVREIGALCRERGVLFHCDAAQGLGKVAVDVKADFIDMLSASAHKMYGPKGTGAIYIRRGSGLLPVTQMDGAGHEGGLRSGTLNVPAIVGFGEACAICAEELPAEAARLTALRDNLMRRLRASIDGLQVNGGMQHRLPHNLNVSIRGVDGDALLAATPEIAVSTGAACSTGHESNYVLRAMGVRPELLQCVVRFGLGRFTTSEEIEFTARRYAEVVSELRAQSPIASGSAV